MGATSPGSPGVECADGRYHVCPAGPVTLAGICIVMVRAAPRPPGSSEMGTGNRRGQVAGGGRSLRRRSSEHSDSKWRGLCYGSTSNRSPARPNRLDQPGAAYLGEQCRRWPRAAAAGHPSLRTSMMVRSCRLSISVALLASAVAWREGQTRGVRRTACAHSYALTNVQGYGASILSSAAAAGTNPAAQPREGA